MIIEHALLEVIEGREEEFEKSMARAFAIIEAAPGCHGANVRRQHENSSTYLLLVKWESVEAHMEGFRPSPAYEQWRQLTHPFYATAPQVTHFYSPIARD
jgi:heme-degrading monooxygenase HmoA